MTKAWVETVESVVSAAVLVGLAAAQELEARPAPEVLRVQAVLAQVLQAAQVGRALAGLRVLVVPVDLAAGSQE